MRLKDPPAHEKFCERVGPFLALMRPGSTLKLIALSVNDLIISKNSFLPLRCRNVFQPAASCA